MTRSILKTLTMGACALLLTASACDSDKKADKSQTGSQEVEASAPAHSPFSADSAFLHIKRQIDFGPRVPNTTGHKATSEYLARTLESYGLEVHLQDAELTAYDGTKLEARNIIARHNPQASRRVLLFAHWDTRPVADHDPEPAKRLTPIPGADDGASGVGVLLEIARLLKVEGLENIGVDIALFDAEDYGAPQDSGYEGNSEETWALGTQHWTQNPIPEGYTADFGILLDMVGAKGATFYREYYSQESAGRYVSKIWDKARALGHGRYFKNEMGGAVTDDHTFVIRNLRIPSVDIINYDPETITGFGSYWHTHGDNLDIISTETLQAVGATVWAVLQDYDEEQTPKA